MEIDIVLICQRYANVSMIGQFKKGKTKYFLIKE